MGTPRRDHIRLPSEPGRGFEDLALQLELAVLTPQTVELLALRRRQAILAAAFVTVGLCDPVADRLRRRFELLRQFLRRATGPNHLDHLPAELRRIRCVLVCHCGLRKLKRSGVHETGATSVST